MPSVSRLFVTLIIVAVTASPAVSRSSSSKHVSVVRGDGQAGGVPRKESAGQVLKERINASTIGLAAGRIEGAPLQFAAELARVIDDGDNMRVLPIVTRGPFDNVFDLLYLRGVDAAIVYGDVLEHFKKNPEIAGISKRINYLASLFP